MKIRLLPVLLAVALLLASCGGGEGGHGDTLTIMGKKSDLEKNYMTRIFELYESRTGGRIRLVEVEDRDFEDFAARSFADGEGADILMHFHNSELNALDVEDNFLYLNDLKWVSELTDSAKAYCTDADGNLLGLPFWENSVSGCYYNKTILDSLGLRLASTQAEFDMLCETLATAGYTPICWPGDGCSWMLQFALDPVFADEPENLERINSGEIGYSDIPAVMDMAEWLDRAARSGWFGKNSMETGWSEISTELASGSSVMTFIWDTWFDTDLKAGRYSAEDFALMPVFMGTADTGTYEGGNLNMMMVNKNSKKLDAALDFLAFCAQPENYNSAFDGISTVSCFKGQTTNIQLSMVTDAAESIAAHERVSTAASRIVGYSAGDMMDLTGELITGRTDPEGFVAGMDESRLRNAGENSNLEGSI